MGIEYIIGIILSLVGYIIYSDTKRKSAESLIENLDTKKLLNESEREIAKNQGLAEAEEERRKEILKDLEHNKAEGDDLEKLRDDFNKP